LECLENPAQHSEEGRRADKPVIGDCSSLGRGRLAGSDVFAGRWIGLNGD
jgi:hypothetical protein